MAKQKPHEDMFADLTFPERGVQDGQSVNFMPQGFTPTGYNVRLYESLTGRARGGSRSGLSKFIPDQHSGDYAIQHLTTIVTVDGALLGRYYTGLTQSFPGAYGGIGFLEQIGGSDLDVPGSDSGYQPAETELRALTMGYRHVVAGTTTLGLSNPTTISISTPAGTWADIDLFVRVVNQDGNSGDYLVETVTIHTDAVGGPGDGTSEATQFDTEGPPDGVHGVADFEVESSIPQTVLYYATNSAVVGHKFRSRNPLRVRFTPYRLSHAASAATAGLSDPITITATLLDSSGSPVVGKTLRLTSSDGATAQTAVTNGSGIATFTVTSAEASAVTYYVAELTAPMDSESTVAVTYSDTPTPQYRQAAQNSVSFGTGADTCLVSLGSDVLAGSLIVVAVAIRQLNGTPTTVAITDSLGNTYTLAPDSGTISSGGGFTSEASIYYAMNTGAGACTVTATLAGGQRNGQVMVHEYINCATTSTLRDTSSATGTSLTPSTGVPTTVAGDLLFAFVMSDGSSTTTSTTVSSPYTKRQGYQTYSAASFIMQTDDYESAAAGAQAEWTMSGSNNWIGIAVSFKKL